MGETAEMMLDGTLCCSCGVFLGGTGDGFPVMCAACQAEMGVDEWGAPLSDDPSNRPQCPVCGKRCKTEAGVQQHMKVKHPTADGGMSDG